MRSNALKAAALAAIMLLGAGSPALAYYPDDHVWDREYQSGVEWNYAVHRKAVPWISSVAWRDRYPTAPSWWSAYAGNAWAPASYTGWYDWRGTTAYNTASYYPGYGTSAQAAAIANAYKNTNAYNGYYNNAAYNNGYYGYYNDGYRAGAYNYPSYGSSNAAAIPTAYLPVANTWASYNRAAANPWDNAMAWNVAWWDTSARPLTNSGYYKAVFDSATNPYSDTRLNQELQVAAAYGDVNRVKYLVGAGADIHARDWEGYTPLTWAAQHGRKEVVDFLLTRYAQPNAVDRWGYTPLMWALQQGHTDIAGMLLAKGGNPRTSTPFGVTPQVLATYSSGGASRGLIEMALAGRRPDYNAYYKRPVSMGYATPTTTYQAPAMNNMAPVMGATGQANVAGAMTAQPMALAGNAAPAAGAAVAPGALISQAEGYAKIAALGASFGNDFKGLMAESTQGGFSLNTLNALSNPDLDTGKNLSMLFGKLAQNRDLKAARTDLDQTKTNLKPTSRFSKYVSDLDETLRQMGF